MTGTDRLTPERPVWMPILQPGDGPALAAFDGLDSAMLSAVHAANPRLEELRSLIRSRASVLLVDPKTPHFQFEGYMAMPEYRALPYSSGRGTLGSLWTPGTFDDGGRRLELIESVLDSQRALGADLPIAPYFYVQRADHPWLDVAATVAREAVDGTSGPIGIGLCVEIDAIVDDEERERIAAPFAELEADLLWLLVVNYDERLADPRDVGAVAALVERLAAAGHGVVPGFVGRTGLLAIAAGSCGYASGIQALEAHPRSFFREMMGTQPTNTYYLSEGMVRLSARTAEAALDTDATGGPCSCSACRGSTAITRMVSRRLAAHALDARLTEVAGVASVPPRERMAVLRRRLESALATCRRLERVLDDGLGKGRFHYLEVLLEAAGGPAATIPGEEPGF